MILTLKRVSYSPIGTFGVLIREDKVPFAVTLEDPDKNNQVGISCIPVGMYTCKRINSPKFGITFTVLDVPGRTHILFHKGNTQKNTRGCILIGEQFDPVLGTEGITHSKKGYNEFMTTVSKVDKFFLYIKHPA